MTEFGTAKLFMHGRGQAMRLPMAFRFPGTEVRVRRMSSSVVLEPIAKRTPADYRAIFDEIDRLSAAHGPFMSEGREPPPMPPDHDLAWSTERGRFRFCLNTDRVSVALQ